MFRTTRSYFKRILKLMAKFVPGFNLRAKLLRMAGYTIGSPVYIGEDLIIVDMQYMKPQVFIGNEVTIAQRVTLVTSSGAPESRDVYKVFGADVGPIHIQDGAWIGAGVIILPNVTIGRSSVVGSGAVVTKDVPPCTVVVGIPAHPIKRFSIETGEIVDL
jgi:acetyltransferase-like isoleucine patch superfamily enzyme